MKYSKQTLDRILLIRRRHKEMVSNIFSSWHVSSEQKTDITAAILVKI